MFCYRYNRNSSLKNGTTNCCESYVRGRNGSSRGCSRNCARACRDRDRFLSCSRFACATKTRTLFSRSGRPAKRWSTFSKKARVFRSVTSWLPERGRVLIKKKGVTVSPRADVMAYNAGFYERNCLTGVPNCNSPHAALQFLSREGCATRLIPLEHACRRAR